MRRNVARQEEIANQYTSGHQLNLSMVEAKRDMHLERRNVTNKHKNDAKVNSILQTETINRQSTNDKLCLNHRPKLNEEGNHRISISNNCLIMSVSPQVRKEESLRVA